MVRFLGAPGRGARPRRSRVREGMRGIGPLQGRPVRVFHEAARAGNGCVEPNKVPAGACRGSAVVGQRQTAALGATWRRLPLRTGTRHCARFVLVADTARLHADEGRPCLWARTAAPAFLGRRRAARSLSHEKEDIPVEYRVLPS